MTSCPREYIVWATLGLLVQDQELGPLWAGPPNVYLVRADPEKYGEVEFLKVIIGLPPPAPNRRKAWDVVSRTFSKIWNAGLLQDMLALQVVYNVWEGGPAGKVVLSICADTPRIAHLLALSAEDLRTYDRPEGVMVVWQEDEVNRIRDARKSAP